VGLGWLEEGGVCVKRAGLAVAFLLARSLLSQSNCPPPHYRVVKDAVDG
jgi:hypothetical protein